MILKKFHIYDFNIISCKNKIAQIVKLKIVTLTNSNYIFKYIVNIRKSDNINDYWFMFICFYIFIVI